MKFNVRHKNALEYFSKYPEGEYHYSPLGIGEGTMKELAKYGYMDRERAWTGYKYQITAKGRAVVGNWTPQGVSDRLKKWNEAVTGKRQDE